MTSDGTTTGDSAVAAAAEVARYGPVAVICAPEIMDVLAEPLNQGPEKPDQLICSY